MHAAPQLKVVIVAAGEVRPADAAELDGADFVIAADGGAAALERLGRSPDLVVGDIDSADPRLVSDLEKAGVRLERHPAEKDATDTELALRAALVAGASEIVLLGALGDRVDHELANVLLLSREELAAVPTRLVRGPETVRLVRSGQTLTLQGSVGDLVTILALGEPTRVTAAGVRWPLHGVVLLPGSSVGVSNEVIEPGASVRVEVGLVLLVERRMEGGCA